MLNACYPPSDSYTKSAFYKEVCCNWICECGARLGAHSRLSDDTIKCQNGLFKLKNNNLCSTIECQMLFLLYKDKYA